MAGYIRGTHPDAYRSGEWARITGSFTDPVYERPCYIVEFPDGDFDWWHIGDSAAGYEFA